MGNWSPYSKEWEKQHLKKMMEEIEAARIAFEKKPWIYKSIYGSLRRYDIIARFWRFTFAWFLTGNTAKR